VSRLVHDIFATQAARTPDAVAVTADDVSLTYRDLDSRANKLANRLVSLGVAPGDRVAVLLDRSPEAVVALLAAMKAGGAYLPVHTGYPADRRQWIVTHAGARVLLTDEAHVAEGVPEAPETIVAATDDAVAAAPGTAPDVGTVTADDVAYVMYTSGSTGEPKGVAVRHGGAVDFVTDPCWDTGRHECVPLLAPTAFGPSIYEILVPLVHGGRVVVVKDGGKDIAGLRALIERQGITSLHLTAGWFRVVAEEAPETFANVSEVLTGGDVIAPGAVARALEACPDLVVRSLYGSTEAIHFSTTAALTHPYSGGTTVSSGSAMAGVELHVLDERLDPVPPGSAGELYIAGRRLAKGYFGSPDLTAEKFVANPYGGDGERMYRTGDLVRRSVDDEIEFIGRVDSLVKILGFRIELSEVEGAVAGFPGLSHVAVVAHQLGPGDTRLAAYVVPDGGQPDLAALRGHVRDLLPEYMVPAAFVVIDRLPLTANGKVDRSALPEPEFGGGATYRAPENPTEEALCEFFRQVLAVPEVGVEDSFFDLGGHSLLAMRLIKRIHKEMGVQIEIRALFNSPTVAGLAEVVAAQQAA
jgi:amino acid adenylation domain-containing protein